MTMTTIRVKKDARYFSASNEPFNDKRLSWEARGLMGYLLSKPNDWEVRMQDLDNQGPAGSRKLRRMLAELRACGYMNRIRTKLGNGKFEWTTEVYESPSQNPNPSKGIVKTSGANCTSAISTSAKRTDILSTEKQSTDSIKDSQIFTALEKLTGGLLRSDTPRMVDTWKEKHPFERIMQAIELARVKGRVPVTYVDSILIGWEANGYPKSREQQVEERKKLPTARPHGPSTNFDSNMEKVQRWLQQQGDANV